MHPLKPYFLGQEQPAGAAPDELPEGVPHGRPRHRRHDRPPPDVLRDARQLLVRRLLQARGGASSPGSSRARASAFPPSASGSRSSRATTRSASAPTRRRSRPGWRSASRASGSSPARAARTSGRPARPGRAARARSCTSTAASSSAAPDDLPGGENARFLEFWNLVFMQYDQQPPDTLTPLPARNIDTGLGLNRMAAILQDVPSVFETDQFRPLIELGETLSGRRYGSDDGGRPQPADPRRPRARDDVPGRRRRRAVERGPRLRAAPRHAPRDPARPRRSASSPASWCATASWCAS